MGRKFRIGICEPLFAERDSQCYWKSHCELLADERLRVSVSGFIYRWLLDYTIHRRKGSGQSTSPFLLAL